MKSLKVKLQDNFVLIISLILIGLTLLAILAPVFAYLKIYILSDAIYAFFQWFCHQRPWRSYHLFDYQLALDARMITLVLSLGVGGLMVYIHKLKPLNIKWIILIISLGILPMAIDGTTQLIAELLVINNQNVLPFYESTNLIRSLTGIFVGTAVSITLFPYLIVNNESTLKNKYFISIITTILITLLMIPILTFFWYISSVKYTPSNMFVDNLKRFPGYNYEITSNGSHSTIKRVLIEPITKFIVRAKYYNRYDYLSDCKKTFPKECKNI